MSSLSDPSTHIHPIFDRVLSREEKEAHLRQKARVVWLFGLSGSGKSTLAIGLERFLVHEGFTTHLLDGDNLRTGLNRGLGFSDADRAENLRRAAEVAKLFLDAGVIAICSFITPLRSHREIVRSVIGAEDLVSIHVSASLEECAKRDPKGLYAKAAAGGVKSFTGRDSGFEEPQAGDVSLSIDTGRENAAASLARLHGFLLPRLRSKP